MSQAKSHADHEPEPEITEQLTDWLRRDYKQEITELAKHYPNEQRSLGIDYRDLHRSNPDIADDYLRLPDRMQRHLEEALRLFDFSVDVTLDQAHGRVYHLDEKLVERCKQLINLLEDDDD